jgi:hypothetical protein
MEYAGVLDSLLAPPPSVTNIRAIPYMLYAYDNYKEPTMKNKVVLGLLNLAEKSNGR